ncbi:unnamed protein product (macronuclear) [Paramecium tetraurelia]|uniref:TPX2 C-terminal domain-containing protein n=1 Tax=Paramecium tetraurelia TaxID=5888 RepID=A0E6M5_PARTE|nr:uncharacterized protein GSPATT00003807001 [Paramecium tetraurelia]CAK90942.1 unnamed protein product [Paramecium tetraurelia]|eukprot:XP_001458339.1 hypothetical protein (macronuclear) [Paramecium tetraurelia strain d4-2]
MKTLVLQYPKQKTMYNPSKPAVKIDTNDQFLQSHDQNIPNYKSLNVVDRLYQQEEKKRDKIQRLQEEKERSLTPNKFCFINKKSQQILDTKNLKPFLERQNELIQEKKMKAELQKILATQEQEEFESQKMVPSRSHSQFIKDSQDWVQYKEFKKQQLADEIQNQNEQPFRPLINPKSAEIADKRMKKSGLHLIDQADRLAMPIRQSFTFQKENYNFQPCINSKSRQLADKYKYQRSQSPWNQY